MATRKKRPIKKKNKAKSTYKDKEEDTMPSPHIDPVPLTFVVVAEHSPKSTYSPEMTQILIQWVNQSLMEEVDNMMYMGINYDSLF
jgi:hypothetical protein